MNWKVLIDKLFPYSNHRESFFERRLGGHFSVGGRIVLYGFNAMHVALNVRLFGYWWCVHPTMRVFGKWWPWYFYVSKYATMGGARFAIGPGVRV